MSIQLHDVATAAQFTSAQDPIEIRGPDGQSLGWFCPKAIPGMSVPESGLTDAELHERANDPNAKWVTPEQVMARLREIDQCRSALHRDLGN